MRITLINKFILFIILLVLMSACSNMFDSFQEEIILPNINYDEAEEKIERYLEEKYERPFTAIKTERACTGLGADCSKEVRSYFYPNDEEDIQFYAVYHTETSEITDYFPHSFWEKEIEEDLAKILDEHTRVAVYTILDPVEDGVIPYYRDVLGTHITRVSFRKSLRGWEDNDQYWSKEAEWLISFKEELLHEGIPEAKMENMEVFVTVANDDDDESSLTRLYKIPLNDVTDLEATTKIIKEYH